MFDGELIASSQVANTGRASSASTVVGNAAVAVSSVVGIGTVVVGATCGSRASTLLAATSDVAVMARIAVAIRLVDRFKFGSFRARVLAVKSRSGSPAVPHRGRAQLRASTGTPSHSSADSNRPAGSSCGASKQSAIDLATPTLARAVPHPTRNAHAAGRLRPCSPYRDGLVELSLTFSAGGRADAHASRRDLRRAIGACGTVWCRRRAGRTPGERSAATGRVRAC